MDDDDIKKTLVWSREPSKHSEPATECGSFLSNMNEWYTLDQHGKHSTTSLIRMALNNSCGRKW